MRDARAPGGEERPAGEISNAGSDATTSNARLIAVFDAALAAVAGLLIWLSLNWPLVGDATIFHFIAGQMQMGAVPYRDIIDVNMPLVYDIHAAIVALGGMSDVAWRAFDLAAAAILSVCILALLRPAGWAAGLLAVFENTDQWPEFAAFLASRYELKKTGQQDYIEWRLYLRRDPTSARPSRAGVAETAGRFYDFFFAG